MPNDDLVVRLQAAVDERAAKAEAAKTRPRTAKFSAYGRTTRMVARYVDDPDDVLRLCQSHRDILAKYARTKQLLAEANQRVLVQVVNGESSTRQEQRDFDSLHIEEAVLREVVEDLARGYGIEHQQGSNE